MRAALRPFALATLSGVLYFVGFVGFDQWYLAFVCLSPLLLALREATTWKRALLLSWWMGLVTHLGGYHWIVHLLRTFAHLNLPLSVLGWVLLCVGQGAILAAFGLLAWLLWRRTGLPLGLTAPVAFVAVELAFPLLFPSYLANSLAWTPVLTQIADLGGVLVVSGMLALVNGGVAELAAALLERRKLPWRVPAAAAGVLAATIGYGVLRMASMDARDAAAPKLRTAIVQANVGASNKHERAKEGIARFRRMTDEAMADPALGLVVWPESGYNRAVGPDTKSLQGDVATDVKVPMILGVLRRAPSPGGRKIWNSAVALAPGGEILAHYDKIMLLAFGEYVPGDRIYPGIYKLLPYSSHFERGESTAPLPVGPWRLSTDICYEDILPRFIGGLMGPIDDAGTRPHAMVNVTNDSWYGPSEPPIHLALATFRAIEHRRWLVRSTATGISAFIDSSGRIVQRSGFEVAETLTGDVPMITAGPTVYGAIGDLFGWLALLASAVGLAWPRISRRGAQAPAEPQAAPKVAA